MKTCNCLDKVEKSDKPLKELKGEMCEEKQDPKEWKRKNDYRKEIKK